MVMNPHEVWGTEGMHDGICVDVEVGAFRYGEGILGFRCGFSVVSS